MASGWWQDIGDKLWGIGKQLVAGVSIFEIIRRLFSEWFFGLIDELKAKIDAVMHTLGVDLAPPPEVSVWISKINVIVPLSEMWGYFLLYLAVASVILGVKWARNLIPGLA